MSEINTLSGYLGEDFQIKCLWQLVTESEFAEKTIPLLEIGYFDNSAYKRFFYVIMKYLSEYEIPASILNNSVSLAINKYIKKTDAAEKELLEEVLARIRNWNDRVLNKDIPHDGLSIQNETINFVKQQEWRKIAAFINNGVKDGDSSLEFLTNIEEKVKKLSEIGDDEDMGIEVMENIARALRPEFRNPIPTGIIGIDAVTKGGLGKGEIGIILAPSGVGKSTILSYIGNTAYNHGFNVLQIVFEDNEDDIRRKHYAKWSKVPLSQMDDRRDEVTQKIVDWHKTNTFGKLIVKKFSQEGTTIPKIRQYIDNYKKKYGVTFDIIILDYIDEVESHRRVIDQNANDLTVIKAFESMASDYNIPCWTAIQTNRSGFNSETVDTSQMGGSIKRAQKTHFLMSIAKTAEQKMIHQANIAILKARMAQDGHVFKDCVFNNDTIEIKITDELPPSTRAMAKATALDDEKIESFNAQYSALKENEELEQYQKPQDNIEEEKENNYDIEDTVKEEPKVETDVEPKDGKSVLEKLHTKTNLDSTDNAFINKMLKENAMKNNILKETKN